MTYGRLLTRLVFTAAVFIPMFRPIAQDERLSATKRPDPANTLAATSEEVAPRHLRLRVYPGLTAALDAALIDVHDDGRARVVTYRTTPAPSVRAIHEGVLPDSIRDRMVRVLRDEAFVTALPRADRREPDLVYEGDRFVMTVCSGDRILSRTSGCVDVTGESVRRLIDDLLAVREHLPAQSLAAAYLMARPVDRERVEKLQQSGRVRFIKYPEFSSDLRERVGAAIGRPREFHPIDAIEFDRLRHFGAHGVNLYVLMKRDGWQVTLYASPDKLSVSQVETD